MSGIFACSIASKRTGFSAFTLDGDNCQPGLVMPNVEYKTSLTDIVVFMEIDSSGSEVKMFN